MHTVHKCNITPPLTFIWLILEIEALIVFSSIKQFNNRILQSHKYIDKSRSNSQDVCHSRRNLILGHLKSTFCYFAQVVSSHCKLELKMNHFQREAYKAMKIMIWLRIIHFLASSFFGSISKGVVLSRKSLAARSCNVPPHFSPHDCSSDFNLSMPRASNSAAELNSS